MKLDRLLDIAAETRQRNRDKGDTTPLEDVMAEAIGEMLAGALPCGVEEPPIVSLGNGSLGILVDDRGDAFTIEEARGYAAAILRQCDTAEEMER